MAPKKPPGSVRYSKELSYGERLSRDMEPFKNSSPKSRTPYSSESRLSLNRKGKVQMNPAPNSTVAKVLGAKKSPYKSSVPAADVSKVRTTPTKRAGESELTGVIRKERDAMRKRMRDAVDQKRAVEYYERKMTPGQHSVLKKGDMHYDWDAIDARDDARLVAKELRKKDVTAARRAAMAPAKKAAAKTVAKTAAKAAGKGALGTALKAGGRMALKGAARLASGPIGTLLTLNDVAQLMPDNRKQPKPAGPLKPPSPAPRAASQPVPKPAPAPAPSRKMPPKGKK